MSADDDGRRPWRERLDRLREFPGRAVEYLERDLWRARIEEQTLGVRVALRAARTTYLALRSLNHHDAATRAAALTYSTILALVPALALTFAIAKGIGAYDQLLNDVVRPTIGRVFESGATGGRQMGDAIDRVLEFVERTDATSLGLAGLFVLALTTLGVLVRVEASLNRLWEVERPRHVVRRIVDFTLVLMISPVLAIIGTLVRSFAPLLRRLEGWSEALHVRPVLDLLVSLTPILFLWIGLTALYRLMPHTRVRVRPAMLAGAVATVLWLGVQELYVHSQLGVARLNRLYASFAAAPLFLVWVYASWLVVLFGAAFGYAAQHLHSHRRQTRAWGARPAQLEALGLRLAARVTACSIHGEPAPTTEELADAFELPERLLSRQLTLLEEAGVVVRSEHERDESWIPAADPQHVTVSRVLRALRGDLDGGLLKQRAPVDRAADHALRDIEEAAREGAGARTLRDLALEEPGGRSA